MGNHKQALEIYVFKLQDPAKAEEWVNVPGPGHGSGQLTICVQIQQSSVLDGRVNTIIWIVSRPSIFFGRGYQFHLSHLAFPLSRPTVALSARLDGGAPHPVETRFSPARIVSSRSDSRLASPSEPSVVSTRTTSRRYQRHERRPRRAGAIVERARETTSSVVDRRWDQGRPWKQKSKRGCLRGESLPRVPQATRTKRHQRVSRVSPLSCANSGASG